MLSDRARRRSTGSRVGRRNRSSSLSSATFGSWRPVTLPLGEPLVPRASPVTGLSGTVISVLLP